MEDFRAAVFSEGSGMGLCGIGIPERPRSVNFGDDDWKNDETAHGLSRSRWQWLIWPISLLRKSLSHYKVVRLGGMGRIVR